MPLQLKEGYSFFLRNEKWKITEVYHTKWEDNTSTKEYKLKSFPGDIRYLEIETTETGENNYSFWKKIKDKDQFHSTFTRVSPSNIKVGNAEFPKKVTFKSITYYYNQHSQGISESLNSTEKLHSVDYCNEEGTHFFSLEIWEDEIEVSTGELVQESDISKIEEGKLSFTESPRFKQRAPLMGLGVLIAFLALNTSINSCNHNNQYNSDGTQVKDSTRVGRSSSSFFRNRNSGGFGK